MKTTAFKSCLIAICFAVVMSVAQAQERVHAISGTVTAIHPKISMMEIETDDGSSTHFRWTKSGDASLEFDKTVRADSTVAENFTTPGHHVIVYYYGDDTVRTVVALHDLGDASVEKTAGTVVKLNRRDHLLTIKNEAGSVVSFHLDPKTVADTATGVAQGFKYDLSKGDHVQVTATSAKGSDTALLIAPAA
jgi:hypothetical protein